MLKHCKRFRKDEDCIVVIFNVFSSFDIIVILCKHLCYVFSSFDIIVIL